ncbi:hypothetical protein mru_1043 [Methanobrevibacter ruminantium M1]|uniref:DUF4145 domain-containing protein n=1 Tax=Methanobrevibacter ruminantium (strain ATCC 35063 / DSM 1093 / JCM 13430 / OCM 146 / M1) TaxID=634498 RepID=D3E2Y3_METRM|nr:hypothetical protein [Methanobrevibacter ruminantium]ADC46894.1 hypothetical protein mru_1043 [Methanobrevibacter ruminantium M1]
MGEFVFSFLEDQFRDIYLDCARMDKNLIEGDGVESILIAGRIAEKITKAIFVFEGIKDNEDNQYLRIEKLSNANILPNNIKNDLSQIRILRNNVYHNTLNSDGSGGFASYNAPKYVQSGGLRDYKTGFNEIKEYSKISKQNSNSNSNSSSNSSPNNEFGSELTAAREAHKLVFNVCVWFYVNYSGDKDFIRPKYKLSRRTQDADFLIRLKSAINDGNDFIKLRQNNPNNEIIQILNEIYVKKAPQEPKEEQVYGINNKDIKIRQPDVPYSKCLGISYDDELFMWHAEHGGKDLGLFESSKEAYEAREIYINSIPMPRKVNGAYSKARGISFSRIQKLWSASVKGQIISYHGSEAEAIMARKKYLKSHNLVDIKVKDGYKTITLEEKAKLEEKIRQKKESSKSDIKTIPSNSNTKDEMEKENIQKIMDGVKKLKDDLNESSASTYIKSSSLSSQSSSSDSVSSYSGSKSSSLGSTSSSSKSGSLNSKSTSNENSSFYDIHNIGSGDKTKKKVKIVNGSKVQASQTTKKVKVSAGNRVSKKHKSSSKNSTVSNNANSSKKSKSVAINKKKSSKYEGVFYEDGLFMWSAEVDGKHLGLFSSEKEAYEKREEYIKNKSNNN